MSCCGIFILGIVIGAMIGSSLFSSMCSDTIRSNNAIDVITTSIALNDLRNGNIDESIKLLETIMNGNLAALKITESHNDRTRDTVAKAINIAEEYQNKYHKNDK